MLVKENHKQLYTVSLILSIINFLIILHTHQTELNKAVPVHILFL